VLDVGARMRYITRARAGGRATPESKSQTIRKKNLCSSVDL